MNPTCDCIDYPVSWTYYRGHCLQCHGFDPGDDGRSALIEPLDAVPTVAPLNDVDFEAMPDPKPQPQSKPQTKIQVKPQTKPVNGREDITHRILQQR